MKAVTAGKAQSSSAWTKYAEALRDISSAFRTSRTLQSNAFILSATSVGTRARCRCSPRPSLPTHQRLRRSKGHSHAVIRIGRLLVNLDAKTVEAGGARVRLTGKEYAMLELLALRKANTLTREMFLNHLYGG